MGLTAFCSDGSGFAMTGENLDVRRKGKEAIEGVDELGEIATGEVGAAITHLKEGVAGEEEGGLVIGYWGLVIQ